MNTPKRFKRHKTLDNLIACLLEIPETDVGNFGVGYKGGEISHKEFVTSITKMGIWGFIDKKSTVHYWMSDKVSFETVLSFVAHETWHFNGRRFVNLDLEEAKAGQFDQVALYVYIKAKELARKLKRMLKDE
jgi:hypothetical protein